DWREAFAAHPRIGEPDRASGAREAGGAGERPGVGRARSEWPAGEQAGMAAATDAVRERLATANREYEARFGFIYIVCATGKTADEMLDIVEPGRTRRHRFNGTSDDAHGRPSAAARHVPSYVRHRRLPSSPGTRHALLPRSDGHVSCPRRHRTFSRAAAVESVWVQYVSRGV